MFNVASILILLLLAVTFIQSAYDKVMDWKGNVAYLKEHFANTSIKNRIPIALLHILVMELISGILSIVGCIQLWVNSGRSFGLFGGIFSCITLIMLLFGQRLAKDYEGAKTIVIYFIPAVMVVYWLS